MQDRQQRQIIVGSLATALVIVSGLALLASRKASLAQQLNGKANASAKLALNQAETAISKENASLAEEPQALVSLRDACLSLRAMINTSYPALEEAIANTPNMPTDPEGAVIAFTALDAENRNQTDQAEALINIRDSCYEQLGPDYALDERKYW